jgi:hypothetical protein
VADGQVTIDAAVAEADSLRKVLKRQNGKQVKSEDERQIIKATALAWFKKHRPVIVAILGEDQVSDADALYRGLIEATGRATTRAKYLDALRAVKIRLGVLQSDHVISLTAPSSTQPPAGTSDNPPQFSPLISDPKMQAILAQRWQECVICVNSGAPLAATVMMGGILEGLLLAKINQLSNKGPVFTAKAAPKDKNTGQTLPLKDWGLKNYIDVAPELKWITTTAKDIGEVMRDYRNYIHPQKQFSHGFNLVQGDAHMLWEIAKSLILQIV